jgi:hypothetical protein
MPVAIRVPVSAPVRVWISVAVTIVLPPACRTLMTWPVVVKLPLPDDRAEARAPAGSKSSAASTGSAANTALCTFIVDSFPALMNSARAGLTAKRPVASEDETARWKVTPGRRPALRPRITSRPRRPGSRPGAACARRSGPRLVLAHTLATKNASTRVLTRCRSPEPPGRPIPMKSPVWLWELRLRL